MTAYTFPSEAWAQAFVEAVARSEHYRRAAKDWHHGSVALVVRPDSGSGAVVGVFLDLDGGMCYGGRFVEGEEAMQCADYVIGASLDRWLAILRGELDPTRAMLGGKLKLHRGSLPTIIRFVQASSALVQVAAQVPIASSAQG